MSVDLSNLSAHAAAAHSALAEIHAARTELYVFLTNVFDRLDALAAEQVARLSHGADVFADEKAAGEKGQPPPRPMERETMQSQIDQLSALTAELTQLAAQQKRLSVPTAVE